MADEENNMEEEPREEINEGEEEKKRMNLFSIVMAIQ